VSATEKRLLLERFARFELDRQALIYKLAGLTAAPLEWAQIVAAHAHEGQVDKAGLDYFDSHVLDVVRRISESDEDGRVVGYLHDVLEDSTISEELLRGDFAEHIVDAVVAITHRLHEPRADYYARVKANPLALRVKLADIVSNTDPDRMALLDDETRARLTEKYRKALEALT